MNGHGESDDLIVPQKPANKGAHTPSGVHPPAELVEGRGSTKGNSTQSTAHGMQGPVRASRGLSGIREAAASGRIDRFTSLLHHVDEALLTASYERLNPRATPGVDAVTWEAYGEDLPAQVAQLKDDLHSGRYRAQPSLRQFISKPNGQQRPLGIAALRDKVAQQALVTVLRQIYEVDFQGFSYGFRPGCSQHGALDSLSTALTERPIQWVLDADIQGFFDAIDHTWMMRFLEHRIGDKRVLRLIAKWLRAGVSEAGQWSPSRQGTPQGSVISPLLANVYLHYVFDLWIRWWRTHVAQGEVIVVRYADDFVIGFQCEGDARRCLSDLKERFAQFALQLHPEKTRLLEFGSMARSQRARRGAGKPESFDFLGFTHLCSRTRDGRFCVRRQSISKRMHAKLKSVKRKLLRYRHQPVPAQGAWLRSVVQGWFNYHAVPLNGRCLAFFRDQVVRHWWRALRRRSQFARKTLWWSKMRKLERRWIPMPKILHPWPNARFAVNHPR